MKVAYILPTFPCLYATFSLNQIREAIRHGIDVQIFALWRGSQSVTNERVAELSRRTRYFGDYFLGLQPNLARLIMKGLYRISTTFDGVNRQVVEPVLGKLGSCGVSKEVFDELGLCAIPLRKIAGVLKNEKFDLIHGAFGGRPATAALALSRLTGLPFSFESHANDLYVSFRRAEEKIQMTSKVFTISEYNKRYLVEKLGCPAEKVTVFRVPIDLDLCNMVQGDERDPNLIVTACRLHSIKGVDTAIAVLDEIREKFPELKLQIFGDGPLRGELENDIRRRGLENRVVLEGRARNSKVLQSVGRASIFLLPCRIGADGDRDGIPTALIEAMYLGTPVVSTTLSGIPELITHGKDGYLAEPDDVESISRIVEKLMLDSTLRTEIGKRAREKVRQEYRREDRQQVILAGWCEILGKEFKGSEFPQENQPG